MARRTIGIDEKIERQKELVSRLKDKYDAALDELEALMRKRDEARDKELIEAFHKSSLTYEEAISLLNSGNTKE